MKRHLALTTLSLFTLAGGSWLAAQQQEAARATTAASRDVAEQEDDHRAVEDKPSERRVADAKPKAESPKTRTPSATSAKAAPRAPQVFRSDDGFRREDDAEFTENLPGADQPRVGDRFFPVLDRQLRMTRMSPADADRMRSFQDAVKQLREAENSEGKAAARDQVEKLVSEQLDIDLESREKELAAIEQRAMELRKQLEERKTAKPELLKMLVMLIDNPQVGLGIPPEWMQMLMRGQPDRYGAAFPVHGRAEAILPPRTPAPPTFEGSPVEPSKR